jgi:hypothetical protein
VYFRLLQLESFVLDLATRPEINAGTFPEHLATNGGLNPFNANFFFAGLFPIASGGPEEVYGPNSFAYFGNATLLGTAATVPEPATILLTTAGLAMLGRRRLRRRNPVD